MFSARALTVFLVLTTAIATLNIPAGSTPGPTAVGSAPFLGTPHTDIRMAPARPAPTIDPDLVHATGRVNILVAISESGSFEDAATLFEFARVLPSTAGTRILRGVIDASRLADLEALPGVQSILKDRAIAFPLVATGPDAPEPMNPLRFPFPARAPAEREALGGPPETTMYDVVEFTGARRAWTDLGVDGTGVTIAIVDTGVDHGAMDLGEAAVARDPSGTPTSFDPDGGTFGRTTLSVSSYTAAGSTFVRTMGLNPVIYIFDIPAAFGPYGPTNLTWSDPRLPLGNAFPADLDITGLPVSRSGLYHFGVLAEWHVLDPYIYLDLFPTIVIDPTTAGVYEAAVLDLSFDYYLNGFQPSPDYSLADEKVLRSPGGPFVASRDMDADGYPDVSAGSLANGLDVWGLAWRQSDRGRVLPPIEPNGDHVIFMYDWFGHGTSVAATAAGRETSHPFAGPGIAPGARIMAVPIFFWGDVIEGWLWASGFDMIDITTPRMSPGLPITYGLWRYTGNHRADVISNSWGVSDWLTLPYFFSNPWYDLVTVFEDALMTPGYSDPAYPGTLFVHAAGNGGAGYGTITEPAFGSLVLSVGASTSLDNTSLAFGGFHQDVMSWSARGPNAIGAPKPDLVMVGAFAYTAAAPWFGNGTGSAAVTLFGGTSQSTPGAAGAAAVTIQAFRGTRGHSPTPFETKSILKSTADDLGYDAFVQGAGQVNVYNGAAFAQNREGLLITSTASWENARERLAVPWAAASNFYGHQVGPGAPFAQVPDTSWFAGTVKPGDAATTEFTIQGTGGTTALSAVVHQRLATLARTGSTSDLGAGWLEGYGALVPLETAELTPGSDLMLVRAHISYVSFDPEADQLWNNRIRIIIGDWVDANSDGLVAPDEVRIFNYGYDTGTTVEARVGFPTTRFTGRPLLWLSQAPAAGRPFAPIAYTIQVEFYDRVAWPWISLPASVVTPGTVAATLTVPGDAAPGVYEAQIIVRPSNGNGTVVPVSVVVPRLMDGSVLSASLTTTGSTAIYDSSRMYGYFDWRWRYEAGDWRLWFVQVDDPTIIALRIDASWQDPDTDVDLWSITPSGIPRESSFSPYLGDGNFLWATRTGGVADFLFVPTGSGFSTSNTGLYTIALHNVLFGSTPPPEPVSGQVAIAKLAPRGPLHRVTHAGETVSVGFNLTTGFPLTNLFWGTSPPPGGSAFPGTASPDTVPNIPSGGSQSLSASFTVPEGTPDGEYLNYIVLGADQLITVVRVDIVVDNTAPQVAITTPSSGSTVSGIVPIAWHILDENPGSTFLTIDGTTRDVTGNTSSTLDATLVQEGTHTIQVRAVDRAGNEGTASVSVTVRSPSSAATASLVTGLGIGALIAAILGFVLGMWVERRRRRPPSTVPSPPPIARLDPTPPPVPAPTPQVPIQPPGPPPP